MILRSVRVTIASGQYDAYWAWSRDIVELWDEGGVVRAGGPYALSGTGGLQVALWLSVHETEEEARTQFQSLYAFGRGKELIEQRPALVSATESSTFTDWMPTVAAPPTAPAW